MYMYQDELKNLYMAIVERAIKDYIEAIQKNKEYEVKNIEVTFFYTQFFRELTDGKINPKFVIEKSHEIAEAKKLVTRRRIKKSELEAFNG